MLRGVRAAACIAAISCAVALQAGVYSNPVLHGDTPDPGVAFDTVSGSWYAVSTSGDAANAFPIWKSSNLTSWSAVGYVFPSGSWPTWAASDFWAPELHFVGGVWTVYFTARHTGGYLSVGVAKSAGGGIAGPYKDLGAPLVADPAMGHIDCTYFMDTDGQGYVIYKSDGNAIGQPTPIWAAAVDSTGTKITSTPVQLITNNPQSWEGPVTEGPWVILENGTYYLFYSGNVYNAPGYAVGVATASSLLGPWTKYSGNPILHTDSNSKLFYGPGHCSVVRCGNQWCMVYHAWNTDNSGRNMLLDALTFAGGVYTVPGNVPSEGSQPAPTPTPGF